MNMEQKKINIGLIGLGARGTLLLHDVLLEHEDAVICAVCDVYEDRCEKAAQYIQEKTGQKPFQTTNYKEIFERKEVDAVLLCSSWESHIHLAIEAMECGKAVGCEVGGAYSIRECWRLVETYEQTKTPIMLMENCCYGRDEMMTMHMVHQGVLGEIVHCAGGYMHDLRQEVAFGKEERHYRLRNYIHRNTENYPTHELGPIAQILGINRGNRMVSLTSMASKAAGLHHYIEREKSEDQELMQMAFHQGDIVTTLIQCANGETITLKLDTTLPRYYSRGFYIQGTKGLFNEENGSVFLEGEHESYDFQWKEQWGNIESYREKYEHPVWRRYQEEGIKRGHDGMDWLVFSDFVEAVRDRKPMPIDVYDMAAWMSISTLAEESILLGSQPMAIPDFTNGAWMVRK